MEKFAVYFLALGAFLIGTTEFVVSGILEVIATDFEVSISLVGQLVTIYALSHAIGALVLVITTQKYERKKVLLFSMALFIVGNLIAFVSMTFNFLMLSRIVLAMSGGLYLVIAIYYASQIASPEKRGSAIATVFTGFTVSLILGVPLGTGYFDWHYIFLFLGIITLINMMLLSIALPKIKGTAAASLKEQFIFLRDKQLLSGLLTTVFWILGYTIVFAY